MSVDLEKKGLKAPVTVTRGALLYAVLMLVISTVTISLGGVVYTNHTQKKADERWCTLFAVLDRPVSPDIKDPVQRERTRQTVALMHQLRVNHGCVAK